MRKLALISLVIGLFSAILVGCSQGGEDGAPTAQEKNAMSGMETAPGGASTPGGTPGGTPTETIQDQ